jgi:Tol biopolymer transport system component
MTKLILSGVAALALLVALGSGASAAVDRTQIAFQSNATGNSDIYTINPDGSGLTNLTNDPASDTSPAWSPTKDRIAFSSLRLGNRDIYVMDADGSGLRRLTTNPGSDAFPSWAPDGDHVLFRSRRSGVFDLYTVAADGSALEEQLTNDGGFDGDAGYSPDGEKIVFIHTDAQFQGESSEAVFVMHADGTHRKQLTSYELEAALPDWSPDGSRIAFVNNVCGTCGDSDLFLMNPGGNRLEQLTHDVGNFFSPSWSRDGTRIALTLDAVPGLPEDIYTLNSDGTGLFNVTDSAFANESDPD